MSDTLKSSLYKFISQNKFLSPDEDLKRYQLSELKEYIQFCCDKFHYIEAYSLALQYVDDILIVFSSNKPEEVRETEAPIIIKILNTVGLVKDSTFELYKQIKFLRNQLVHKLINRPEVIKKIKSQKNESHKERIIRLINEVDQSYLDLVKKFPDKFYPSNNVNILRFEKISYIVSGSVMQKIEPQLINLRGQEWTNKFRALFISEFKTQINNLFGIK